MPLAADHQPRTAHARPCGQPGRRAEHQPRPRRQGRPGTHRAPRRHHRRGGRGRPGRPNHTRPRHRHGHARRGLPHRRRGNETRPRHGHGRTSETPRRHRGHDRVHGIHLRDAGGHARHGAGKRMDQRGGRGRVAQPQGPVLRRILQGSGTGHRTHQRPGRMDHGLEPQPGTRPRPRLAGGGGTSRTARARHPRTVRHRREEAVASAGMAPIARHQPAVGRIVLDMARRRRPAELRADPRGPGHARQGPRPLRPQDRPHRPARHRRQDSDPLQPVRKLARRRRERPARLDGHDHRRNGTHSHARHRRSHAARRTARHRHVPQRMDLGHRPRHARRPAPRAEAQRLRRPATRRRRTPRRLPGVSTHAARNKSSNGGNCRSTPRPRAPTRRTRNGSNTWPACWNAYSPPHWRPSRSRRRWEPRGSPPGTSTTS